MIIGMSMSLSKEKKSSLGNSLKMPYKTRGSSFREHTRIKGEKINNFGRWTPAQFSKQEQAEAFSKLPFTESVSGIIEAGECI